MQGRKERTFNCPDCGVEVTTMYNRTLRCKECAKKRLQEQSKHYWIDGGNHVSDAENAYKEMTEEWNRMAEKC